MSMSVISKKEVLDSERLKNKQRNSLLIDDIEGTRTLLPGYKFKNKPHFDLNIQDIRGTSS